MRKTYSFRFKYIFSFLPKFLPPFKGRNVSSFYGVLFTRKIILCMDFDVALRLEKIERQKQ